MRIQVDIIAGGTSRARDDYWEESWYEQYWLYSAVAQVTAVITQLYVVFYQGWFWWPASVMALFFYASAALFDKWSTLQAMKHKPAFDRLGYRYPIEEENERLPRQPTAVDLIRKEMYWPDLLVVAAGFFIPGLLVGTGMGRSLGGLGNLKNKQRVEQILQAIYQEHNTGL